MCHFVYLASPLSVSEIRSMLPEGVTLDVVTPGEARVVRAAARDAATVVRIVAGACSCDFFVERSDDPVADERELRARYRALRMTRDQTIAALQQHRRGAHHVPLASRQRQLATFAREHARNAGVSLFLRVISDGAIPQALPGRTSTISSLDLAGRASDWLPEDALTWVVP